LLEMPPREFLVKGGQENSLAMKRKIMVPYPPLG